jgi:hypothetical protein
MAAMSKPKQSVAASELRTTVRHVRSLKETSGQDLVDERVIAEADDESAWEAPIDVKRRVTSLGLPANLAQRAAFLARLHREKGVDAWLERIIRERVELEERAFGEARRELGARRTT